MNKYILELYITGNSLRSEMAVKSLNKLFESTVQTDYELQVIDVLESPEMAESEKVLATPTLIKRTPPPVRRLIGDMSNIEKVKYYLDIQ